MDSDDRTLDDILGAVRDRFPDLSPQLQRGARILIDQPEEVAVSSMRDIAGRIGVQPATLVRLAKSLGFSGWPALRQKFIDRIRSTPDPFSRRAADLVRRGASSSLFHETFDALSAALAATKSGTQDDVIAAVADLLDQAETVYVAGFRSCFAPAFNFYYAYRLFRQRTLLLLSGTAGMFEAELRALTARDAVVLLGFDPYSREAGIVAEVTHRVGAKLVAVTDSAVSPLTRHADHVLLFSTQSPSFFPSVVAASALLECVVAVLVARAGEDAVASVRAAEAQLYELGAYLLPPRGHRPKGLPPKGPMT
jgi:DNA-binding MurR/RpiR family transcriptional regulator